ncbi:hypothetical protein HN011_004546, partial [Eciton burchellii]
PRPGRRPRRRPGNAAQLQAATPRVQSPISQHLEKGKTMSLTSHVGDPTCRNDTCRGP